ncbi:hypothetical protein [Bosea lathyri]|uniref:hypothetical protein n=1 Tax=Bosea lathyri TaxID=1036778 RepID=UPI00190EF6FE|nr:hypothetical protein [Bosea lathyri]
MQMIVHHQQSSPDPSTTGSTKYRDISERAWEQGDVELRAQLRFTCQRHDDVPNDHRIGAIKKSASLPFLWPGAQIRRLSSIYADIQQCHRQERRMALHKVEDMLPKHSLLAHRSDIALGIVSCRRMKTGSGRLSMQRRLRISVSATGFGTSRS